jgi:hypothetical protein
MNKSQAIEILNRAGLNPADWNVSASVKHANRWIEDQKLELAEGGPLAEFGSLEVVDYLQQCLIENSLDTDQDTLEALWERTEANEFADWQPVWQA